MKSGNYKKRTNSSSGKWSEMNSLLYKYLRSLMDRTIGYGPISGSSTLSEGAITIEYAVPDGNGERATTSDLTRKRVSPIKERLNGV